MCQYIEIVDNYDYDDNYDDYDDVDKKEGRDVNHLTVRNLHLRRSRPTTRCFYNLCHHHCRPCHHHHHQHHYHNHYHNCQHSHDKRMERSEIAARV